MPRAVISFLLLAVCLTAAPASAQTTSAQGRTAMDPAVARLLDEAAIARVADALDAAVDAKDWALARSFFMDEIAVDFSSMGAGPPTTMKADDLIGAWRRNLFAEKASFHLRGNHRAEVSGDKAVLRSHGYAWNRYPKLAPDDLWEVWGFYTYDLVRTPAGGKIARFVFDATHQRGNPAVPDAQP